MYVCVYTNYIYNLSLHQALGLSTAARSRSTVGTIVNLMSVDAARFNRTPIALMGVWNNPIMIGNNNSGRKYTHPHTHTQMCEKEEN